MEKAEGPGRGEMGCWFNPGLFCPTGVSGASHPLRPLLLLTSNGLTAGVADGHRVLGLPHGVGAVPGLAALVLPVFRGAGRESWLGRKVPCLSGRRDPPPKMWGSEAASGLSFWMFQSLLKVAQTYGGHLVTVWR